MFYFDPNYFLYIVIPTLLLSLGVQVYLKSTFAKWSKIQNSQGLNGMQVGRELFSRTSLTAIPLERVPGALSDHFDPGANVVRLSDVVANQPTVAAMAVCAHELGHVQQYQSGSALIGMRNFLLPALQFSPALSYIAIFLGFFFNITGLVWVGIFFFGLMVLFSILTLPVEIDASRRALVLLKEANLVSEQDIQGSRAVLTAAALTYLAAAITSILQLLYYISLARRD